MPSNWIGKMMTTKILERLLTLIFLLLIQCRATRLMRNKSFQMFRAEIGRGNYNYRIECLSPLALIVITA